MQVKFLSPTAIEQALQCEARLAGKLNQLGEDEWEEEHGEGKSIGALAHNAAKVWYRPNAKWLERLNAGEDHEVLAKQASTMRDQVNDNPAFSPRVEDTEKNKVDKAIAKQDALDQVDDQIQELGLLKHCYTNPNHAFRLAISDTARSKYGNELPREASGTDDARTLFGQILSQYNRDQLNVVFAERRYKGQIANGVPIHTILDLGIDRGDGRLELIDYKTGWITSTTEEMYDKHQVKVNLLAVARYDDALSRFHTKSFTYFWVRPGFETGPVSFSLDRLIDYEHWLSEFHAYILGVTEPTETINRFCLSCSRRFSCKKFVEMVSEAMGLGDSMTEEQARALSDEQIMVRHNRVTTQIKLLEETKSSLGSVLMGKMQTANVTCVKGSEFKATIRQNRSDGYDVATVLSLCVLNKLDTATIVGVTKTRVDEVFSSNLDAMRMLNLTKRRSASCSFLAVSHLSKKDMASAQPAIPKKERKSKEKTPAVPDQSGVTAPY